MTYLAEFSITNRLERMIDAAGTTKPRRQFGILRECVGPLVRVTLSGARIGDLCELSDAGQAEPLRAEVVAIRDNDALLCPFGSSAGLSAHTKVVSTGAPLTVAAGDGLLGRTLDAFGIPLDGDPLDFSVMERRPVRSGTPNPVDRPLIDSVLATGIRAIDGFLTVGIGQRVGVFGEPGTGKSVLLSMIARNASFDVCVIGMIGERGREVREFLERRLPVEHRARCVTVVSTSDRPSMERVIGAYMATTIAEYFRDRGLSVLLLIDSVTRFARALREVGLAAGEPAVRRGFPSSVFAELPKLIERSGKTNAGTITAIYSLLVDGDAGGDPISEEVRSLTDGHIVLSAQLAQAGHFPSIDILASRSRVMDDIVSRQQRAAASHTRRLLQKYTEIELLIQVGEFQAGADPVADEAIRKRSAIQGFCQQRVDETMTFEQARQGLEGLIA